MANPDDDRNVPAKPPADDIEHEERAAILKRRAMFVASAIAGLSLASACGDPQPCLKVAPPTPPPSAEPSAAGDAGTEAVPAPPDAGVDAGGDAAPPDAGAPDASSSSDAGVPPPQPCLSPPPRPCLKIAPPPHPCLTPVRPPQPDPPPKK